MAKPRHALSAQLRTRGLDGFALHVDLRVFAPVVELVGYSTIVTAFVLGELSQAFLCSFYCLDTPSRP